MFWTVSDGFCCSCDFEVTTPVADMTKAAPREVRDANERILTGFRDVSDVAGDSIGGLSTLYFRWVTRG